MTTSTLCCEPRQAARSVEAQARQALRDRLFRLECWRAAGDGRKYLRWHGVPQAVSAEAIRILRARAERRKARDVAEAARRGPSKGRIVREAQSRRLTREQARRQRISDRLAAGRLGRSTLRKLLLDQDWGSGYRHFASAGYGRTREENTAALVRAAVSLVGRIGDQCERDLTEFAAGESFRGKRGQYHVLEGSELEWIGIRRDCSAMLITMCDYCSFGRHNGQRYESRGGPSYRCYLVVRDATSGEAHILRVPPRFGTDSQFAWRVEHDLESPEWRPANPSLAGRMRRATPTERLIHAAIAWTFGLRAGEYDPQLEA